MIHPPLVCLPETFWNNEITEAAAQGFFTGIAEYLERLLPPFRNTTVFVDGNHRIQRGVDDFAHFQFTLQQFSIGAFYCFLGSQAFLCLFLVLCKSNTPFQRHPEFIHHAPKLI